MCPTGSNKSFFSLFDFSGDFHRANIITGRHHPDRPTSLGKLTGGFPVDVEYLFYSIRYDKLILVVRECIEINNEITFTNFRGLSVESFMELLACYLDSNPVPCKGELYVQKHGICMGSRFAPVLCDIFWQDLTGVCLAI